MRWLFIAAAMVACGAHAETLSLARKAEVFQHDMECRFLLDGQALCKLKVPTEDRPFDAYNMPDNAYMTGIYLGTLAMKYAVTGDEETRAKAAQSIAALHLLCTVSGRPGLLARAAWPATRPMEDDGIWRLSDDGRYRWRGDVSSDQVDGVLYGFSLAHELVADEAQKKLIAGDVAALVGHILDNDLRIIGYDGEVTTWGKYWPEYVKRRAKMNALLWLQALKVAVQTTGEARFEEAYRKYAFDEGYAEIGAEGRLLLNPNFRGAVNHSDDVLLFLAYEPLLRLETDETLRAHYLRGFRRMYEGNDRFPGVKPEANPIYAFLAARYLDDTEMLKPAANTLRWFPFRIKWNTATIAAYEEEFGFKASAAPQSPEPAEQAPLPIDRRGKTWSAWVQDPYNSAGDAAADSPMEFNGHDYLLGYWLGRYYGYID